MLKALKIFLFLAGAVAAGALAAEFLAGPQPVQQEASLQRKVTPGLPEKKPEPPAPAPMQTEAKKAPESPPAPPAAAPTAQPHTQPAPATLQARKTPPAQTREPQAGQGETAHIPSVEEKKALERLFREETPPAAGPVPLGGAGERPPKFQDSLIRGQAGETAGAPPPPGPSATGETEIAKSQAPTAGTGGFVTDDTQTGMAARQPEAALPQTGSRPQAGLPAAVPQPAAPPAALPAPPPGQPAPPGGDPLPPTRQSTAQPPLPQAPGTAPEAGTGVAAGTPQQGIPLPNPKRRVSLEEKIGQMLIFGFQGSSPDQPFPQAVARQLASGTLGGVIFLRYNLPDARSAERLMRYFHKAAASARHTPFFVLDQEGGRVQRLGRNVGVKRWREPERIAREGSLERARAEYEEMAEVIRRWGFNVNLAPVVDVNVNKANPIIGKLGRSFSDDPETVVRFSRVFIDAHRKRGILTALKHFPGHGSSARDSHLGFTDISATWKEKAELAPYKALIRSGHADMVMMGHLFLDRFHNGDAKKYPATLSKTVIDTLLRSNPEMSNYDGVIISDDMEMGAIRKHYKRYDAAIRAIKAGVDLLIVSNSAKPRMDLPELYVTNIAREARNDKVLQARIEKSYERIVRLKARIGRSSGVAPARSTRKRQPPAPPPMPARSPRKSAAPAPFDRAALAGSIDRLFAVPEQQR